MRDTRKKIYTEFPTYFLEQIPKHIQDLLPTKRFVYLDQPPFKQSKNYPRRENIFTLLPSNCTKVFSNVKGCSIDPKTLAKVRLPKQYSKQ